MHETSLPRARGRAPVMSRGQDAARRETHASVSTIGAVIERMRAIEAGLPQADGVARFNDLYWP